MDCIKAKGWPSWRQQIKRAVVAMAVLFAAGALYLQLKKNYGFKDHINAELQRDYGGSARLDNAEMLKDYSNVARVYHSSNADTTVHKSPDNAGGLDGNYVISQPTNTSTSKGGAKEVLGPNAPQKSDFLNSKENMVRASGGDTANVASTSPGSLGVDDHGNEHEGILENKHSSSTSSDLSMTPSPVSRGNRNDGSDYNKKTAPLSPPIPASSPPSPGPSFLTVKNQYTRHDPFPIEKEEASMQRDVAAPSPSPSLSIKLSTGINETRDSSLKEAKASASSPPPSPLLANCTSSNTSSRRDTIKADSTHLPANEEDIVTIDVSSNSGMHDENNSLSTGFIRRARVDSTEESRSYHKELPSSKGASKVPLWPLSKLELELFAAKEAIQNAPLSNSSSYKELHAPIYLNLSQFIKSYELMEKMFRVYVYKEGKEPLVHTGPVFGIYSSEGLFIRQMEGNKRFRTESVEEALALFLPYSVANMVDKLYVPHSTSMLPLSSFIKSYVNEVAARHNFWNRTRGGDHFFVSCHDWGLMTTYEHDELRHNAIKVLCNADETTEFKKGRDTSLPEFYMHENEKLSEGGTEEEGGQRLGRQQPQRRDTLAFFAGQIAHGRVRPMLLKYWEYPKGGREMQVYGVLPATEARRLSYKQRMRTSQYCLCPMGYEVNSPRVVEAIEAMCVPVIIADGFVLPFSDVLDWSSFSITIPEKDIPSLKSILQGISEDAYMTMQRRLPYVRRHFTWHLDPQPFDTFHMILHSVWTSRLTNITSLQI